MKFFAIQWSFLVIKNTASPSRFARQKFIFSALALFLLCSIPALKYTANHIDYALKHKANNYLIIVCFETQSEQLF
jgi:hypothetical protein